MWRNDSGEQMIKARVTGTGSHLPEKILTNKDIEAFCDTDDEWIRQRTGIEQRH
jgi:3-oxoacyl-[acyl-carrier-protein] synthase-3